MQAYGFIAALFLTLSGCAVSPPAADASLPSHDAAPAAPMHVPDDWSPFVPAGFELLRVVRGDLNADGRDDAVVVATPGRPNDFVGVKTAEAVRTPVELSLARADTLLNQQAMIDEQQPTINTPARAMV